MARHDPHTPRGGAYAARIRAAAGYADLDRVRLGESLGVSRETVSRLFAGKSEPSLEARREIAAACGVPEWFMETGFEGVEELDDQRQSVGQLAAQLREERDARKADVARLEAQISQLAEAVRVGAEAQGDSAARNRGSDPRYRPLGLDTEDDEPKGRERA